MYIELGEKVLDVEYKTRKAAYAVILNDNEEAAIIKTPRACFLPGGGIEIGESYEQCVIRELLEETGYEFKLKEFIGCAAAYEFSPRLKQFMKGIGYFFSGQIGAKVCVKKEADHELVWMKCDDAIKNLVLLHQVWALEEIFMRNTEKKSRTENMNRREDTLISKQSILCSALMKSWSSKSSTKFSLDNPSKGQCGVTALVVDDYMKGEIFKTLTPEGWHFYNVIDGVIYDYTDMQFEDVIKYDNVTSTREEALKYSTQEQYDYLKAEVAKYL